MSRTSGCADAGSIVAGWLVKIALVLAVLGVCLFDAISIGTTYMNTEDTGNSAARAGSEAWVESGKNLQRAYDAALNDANDGGATYTIDTKTFRVDADGTVHLTIHSTASTILVRRIGPLRHWANVSHDAEGTYLP